MTNNTSTTNHKYTEWLFNYSVKLVCLLIFSLYVVAANTNKIVISLITVDDKNVIAQ